MRALSVKALQMLNRAVRSSELLMPRSFRPSVISYTNARDCLKREMVLDPNNTELRDISVAVKSVVITPDNKESWTNRLLCSGLCGILKKVNEESAELILAACAQDGVSVILEAADLIFHVMLVLRPLRISFESITSVFRNQINSTAQIYTLGVLERLAVSCYNRMVVRRNRRLLNNYKVESVIADILEKLSREVFLLCFLSARIGTSVYVNISRLKDAVYNILFSVLLILHHRDISYQDVVEELYSGANARIAKPSARAGI
ncbi:Phosphoribosyl-ATP pyrophosphatase [Candidatus Hodgkinia cicadicola]|nr:Phosphoribosyl-ATP pyrophosphatase [Candidatus Hodgkinia cicadicola]